MDKTHRGKKKSMDATFFHIDAALSYIYHTKIDQHKQCNSLLYQLCKKE